MTQKEAIIAVRELISDPKRWTQGVYARRIKDDPIFHHSVTPQSKDATCWCMLGAVIKVCSSDSVSFETDVTKTIESLMPTQFGGIAKFNDSHTHAEVLALLDSTIEKLS